MGKFIFEANLLRQFAAEIIAELSAKHIEDFRLNFRYEHFGYGLYLRNRFRHRAPYFPATLGGDQLGTEIYAYILAGLFFESPPDMEQILELAESDYFSEMCARYYLRNGTLPFEKYPLEQMFSTVETYTEIIAADLESDGKRNDEITNKAVDNTALKMADH